MSFRKNYLPRQSQPWAREIQSRIQTFEKDFTQSEINNRTRDDQLQASYNRLDKAFVDLKLQQDSLEALINNIYVPETEELNGVKLSNGSVTAEKIEAGTITADEISSEYVYAGSIAATQITAGTLTGFTIQTSSSGQRVLIQGSTNDVRFYNSSGNLTGNILGSTNQSGKSLQVSSEDGFLVLANGSSVNFGSNDQSFFTVLSGNTQVNEGTFSVADGKNANFSGNVFNPEGYNNTTSAPPNMYISTTGLLMRNTDASTKEVKTNIREINFDTKAFLSINPVVFNYKPGILSDEDLENPNEVVGFIAEDFEATDIAQYVVRQAESEKDFKSLRYDKLYMFLHKAVQELNQRVTELENG